MLFRIKLNLGLFPISEKNHVFSSLLLDNAKIKKVLGIFAEEIYKSLREAYHNKAKMIDRNRLKEVLIEYKKVFISVNGETRSRWSYGI